MSNKMNPLNDQKRTSIQSALKSGIRTAWYNLDKKSFEKWLEGKRTFV
jgi:hypothetical protein